MITKLVQQILIITIFLSLCIGSGLSCVTTRSMTAIRDHELRGEQWQEFNSIREYWVRNVFPGCLKESNLRLTCDGCESIYIVVRITINSEGKLCGYQKIHEHVCGKSATVKLEHCFIDYFQSIIFPKKLRSMIIETRLGNGLKC